MNEMVKKPIFWLVIVMGLLVGGMFFVRVLEERVTDRVMKRLFQPYSPSPFGPGVDMDKIEGKKAVLIKPQPETSYELWHEDWEDRRSNLSQ